MSEDARILESATRRAGINLPEVDGIRWWLAS